jgi:hypothetical protein
MSAWHFDFPSAIELTLWRVASIYTLVFTILGGIWAQYCHKVLFPQWDKQRRPNLLRSSSLPRDDERDDSSFAAKLRNIHHSKDPRLDIPLRAFIPMSILCAFYCVCRIYILVEDFIGLRSLPGSAFQTVQWSDYVPHW